MLGRFGSDPKPYNGSLLTDTKTAEDFPEQIITRDLPSNFTQRNLDLLQVFRHQLSRQTCQQTLFRLSQILGSFG